MMPSFLSSCNLLSTDTLPWKHFGGKYFKQIPNLNPNVATLCCIYLAVISTTAVGNRSTQARTHCVMTVYHLKLTWRVS